VCGGTTTTTTTVAHSEVKIFYSLISTPLCAKMVCACLCMFCACLCICGRPTNSLGCLLHSRHYGTVQEWPSWRDQFKIETCLPVLRFQRSAEHTLLTDQYIICAADFAKLLDDEQTHVLAEECTSSFTPSAENVLKQTFVQVR